MYSHGANVGCGMYQDHFKTYAKAAKPWAMPARRGSLSMVGWCQKDSQKDSGGGGLLKCLKVYLQKQSMKPRLSGHPPLWRRLSPVILDVSFIKAFSLEKFNIQFALVKKRLDIELIKILCVRFSISKRSFIL